MPVIKQKQIRHFALDRCFRNKTAPLTDEEIAAEGIAAVILISRNISMM